MPRIAHLQELIDFSPVQCFADCILGTNQEGETPLRTSCTSDVGSRITLASFLGVLGCILLPGCELFNGSSLPKNAAVTITASPASISAGATSTLTVVAVNATQVTVSGSDGSTYNLSGTGGTQTVKPSATTTYTAVAS